MRTEVRARARAGDRRSPGGELQQRTPVFDAQGSPCARCDQALLGKRVRQRRVHRVAGAHRVHDRNGPAQDRERVAVPREDREPVAALGDHDIRGSHREPALYLTARPVGVLLARSQPGDAGQPVVEAPPVRVLVRDRARADVRVEGKHLGRHGAAHPRGCRAARPPPQCRRPGVAPWSYCRDRLPGGGSASYSPTTPAWTPTRRTRPWPSS